MRGGRDRHPAPGEIALADRENLGQAWGIQVALPPAATHWTWQVRLHTRPGQPTYGNRLIAAVTADDVTWPDWSPTEPATLTLRAWIGNEPGPALIIPLP
jgi:hypothetical protein